MGIGFVAYSPLGRGFLTGRFKTQDDIPQDDWRRHHPRFEGENFKRNLHLAEAVRQIAEEIGCTPAQLALAWVLAQGEDIVPIPGTKHTRYLEENLGALNVHLTDEHLRRLDEAFPRGRDSRRALPRAGYARHQSIAMVHDGKVAIVTGGGRGLGRAMALGLSRAGFRVAITAARTRDEIEAVAREAPPGRIYPVMADVSRESACAALIKEVEARLGPVDVLVNNAGRGMRYVSERFLSEPTLSGRRTRRHGG